METIVQQRANHRENPLPHLPSYDTWEILIVNSLSFHFVNWFLDFPQFDSSAPDHNLRPSLDKT